MHCLSTLQHFNILHNPTLLRNAGNCLCIDTRQKNNLSVLNTAFPLLCCSFYHCFPWKPKEQLPAETSLSLLTHQSQGLVICFLVGKISCWGMACMWGKTKLLPHWVRHNVLSSQYSFLDGFIDPLHFICCIVNFFPVF